jgi:cytochrome P450
MDSKYGGRPFTELGPEDMFNVVDAELPYLRGAVLESLRLHPPAMKNVKFCVEEVLS